MRASCHRIRNYIRSHGTMVATTRVMLGPWLLATMLITGCAIPPGLQTQDPGFPAGTVIHLNQPLTIPPDKVTAALRGGSVGSRYRYQATCLLEIRTLRSSPFVVEPDAFTVLGINRDRDPLTGPAYPGIGSSFYSLGEGPGLAYFNTYIYLTSEQQPDVLRIKCSELKDNDLGARFLSEADIRTVLGNTVTIERP